mmetsp:Transcript_12149/g.28040  ORF Transcript_12149/g.28040 Transcript_12149/m.28040 type:complete len:231 (+) Transcript_12149:337-1029(+)
MDVSRAKLLVDEADSFAEDLDVLGWSESEAASDVFSRSLDLKVAKDGVPEVFSKRRREDLNLRAMLRAQLGKLLLVRLAQCDHFRCRFDRPCLFSLVKPDLIAACRVQGVKDAERKVDHPRLVNDQPEILHPMKHVAAAPINTQKRINLFYLDRFFHQFVACPRCKLLVAAALVQLSPHRQGDRNPFDARLIFPLRGDSFEHFPVTALCKPGARSYFLAPTDHEERRRVS